MAIGQNRAKVPCLIFVLVYQGFERNKAIRQDSGILRAKPNQSLIFILMELKTITLRVSEDLAQVLEFIAKELGISIEELLENALEHYIDYLDLAIAKEREREVLEGKSQTISAEEVWAELGI